MDTNLEKYKSDLKKLIALGDQLMNSIQYECHPESFEKVLKKQLRAKKKIDDFKKTILNFERNYQQWYSEALTIVKLLLPDRLEDFIKLYEKPKGRKQIKYGNYVIEDYLQKLSVTSGFGDKVVGPEAAIPQFQQQLNILKSAQQRFGSSLFDIKQLVQAGLFDSELDAAKELNKKGFTRGAGAIAGVVLEGHLFQVCDNHKLIIKKKNPGINDLGQLLKDDGIIEIPTWRKIQHLADLRNLCDHKKKIDPKKDDIEELIDGVVKIIKTLF